MTGRDNRTPLWTSEELRAATGGTLAAEIAITGISIDTRSLEKGDLFIALVGETSDGHAHIAAAFDKGAACVMVHDTTGNDDPNLQDSRLLHVRDTMEGLRAMGSAARARFAGRMIAVTGSVGKTTTKNMLQCALSSLGPTHAAVASYNNHWGVPLTLARMPRESAFCVAEIGMNHRGEIAPLAAMVRPDIALITTIGSSHLGYMGSVEAIAEEKSDLIAALPATGIAIVPDNTGMDRILDAAAARSGCKLMRMGQSDRATFRLGTIKTGPDGSSFTIDNISVKLSAPGSHLVHNAALALAALHAMDLPLDKPVAALAQWRPGAGRGQIQPILNGQAALLDESYNASVLSIRAALATLSLVPGKRHIAVLGDIRELGEFAESEHLSLVPDVTAHADLVFCCCAHMRHVFNALAEEKRGVWQPDAASLAPFVQSILKAGDVVLVKGSLGSRMRDIVAPLLAVGVQA